eukprot:CAMPEP_0170784424 /NCGR_PEP_ID=MMETSP0733-20121128/16177_1 /TAXON_ID=186038 /ORGANISM="Fragilariopsis kerguelensis, Strain L26-C5" /LENGTH=77 /DNA_ID=CAMNT_0011129433 /DNA_START=11 /DNA_END=245 /DNA_ORIENTATION=-
MTTINRPLVFDLIHRPGHDLGRHRNGTIGTAVDDDDVDNNDDDDDDDDISFGVSNFVITVVLVKKSTSSGVGARTKE